jgi:predicted RNase H-like nuclease (RuvC/YqgF family)
VNQWEPKDPNINLPPNYGTKLGLIGNIIVVVGDVLSTLGIAFEKEEEVEENATEEIGNLKQVVSETTNSKSLPDIGFALSLLGSIIITFGDALSTTGAAIGLEESTTQGQQEVQEKMEQERQIREMQNQINSLQTEIKSMLRITDAMRREIISLQRATKIDNLPINQSTSPRYQYSGQLSVIPK